MVENLLSIRIQNDIDCFWISTKLTFLLWTPSLFIEDWWPKNGLSLSHGYDFFCMSSKIMAQANNLHNTIKCPRFNKWPVSKIYESFLIQWEKKRRCLNLKENFSCQSARSKRTLRKFQYLLILTNGAWHFFPVF